MEKFDLNFVVTHPGYQLVATKIFRKLDPKSLANCRTVSEQWKNFIDNDKSLVRLQICQILTKTILETNTQVRSNSLIKELIGLFSSSTKFKLEQLQSILSFVREKQRKSRLFGFFVLQNDLKANLIFSACYYDSEGIIKAFLANGIDISVMDENRRTPLHYACIYGSMKIVNLLKQSFFAKRNVNISDFNARDIHSWQHSFS